MTDLFRIRDHVADFDALVGDILARSAATCARLPMIADVATGPGPGDAVDIFLPAAPASGLPVHMFIHGGYWRMFSKRDYACIADTVTAAGAIAVIVDYSLMPTARMATLVEQVRRARDWVRDNIDRHGGDPARLSVSGHSAGAHLASFLFTADQAPSGLRAALLLGGLYDLEPLRSSFLQAEVGLTDEEVAAFTPLTQRHAPGPRVEITLGAEETPPFHSQAAAFAAHLSGQGVAVTQSAIAARNHMTSVRDLAIPDSDAGRMLTALIRAT